ncbi:MAG: PAS domain-containing protein [Vicinamibacterales bacterium]
MTHPNGARRIALGYAAAGIVYILVSDRLVTLLFDDIDTITLVMTLKGWGFVLVTSALLWVMIKRHVADLLASESARLEREAFVATVVDSVGGYLYVKDLDYRYQFANAAVCDLFGVTPTTIVGCEDSQFLDAPTAAGIRDNDRRVIERGERVEAEEIHVGARGGEPRNYMSVKIPLRRADGTIIGLCGISTDITDIKAAEAERTRLREQLVQAQKMETIGQLTGGIAHDFNNILTSILGHASLLQALDAVMKDPAARDYADEITIAGERARDLVKNMLRFSRGHATDEADVQALRPQPVVAEAVKMLTATIPSSIRMETDIDARAASILLDPVQLHQLITNLVINARDAMNGIGTIRISLADRHVTSGTCAACHSAIEGQFVELSVADTGSGIAPEHLQAIFEPFFTTKEVGKGTGLGLSVVHGILHQAGGHIEVRSTVGRGTTIGLLFPALVQESSGGEVRPVEVPAATSHTWARVMVVDDEPVLTRLARTVLERRGMQVTSFNDSQAALAAFAAAPADTDLVITDQTMPGLTGDELARRMLAIRADLPVLLCTGYSDLVDGATAAAIGVRRYLSKPIAIATLVQAVIDELPPTNPRESRGH